MARLLDRLSPRTIELLAEALDRIDDPSRTTSINDEVKGGGKPATRQAKNNRLLRALASASVHCVILATREKKFARLLFEPDFALLRIYSAECYAKLDHLAGLGHLGDTKGWQQLFLDSRDHVLDTASKAEQASRTSHLIALNCLAYMFAGAMLHRSRFAPLWSECWKNAQLRGIDRHPYFGMVLSLLGCEAGETQAYIDCLHDPRRLAFDMADLLCFVRRDHHSDLYYCIVELMRGHTVSLHSCLYPGRPASTLRYLLQYVRSCLRRPSHFYNEGLALGVLIWAQQVIGFVQSKEMAKALNPTQLASLDKEIKSFDLTCAMERGRLAGIIEAVDADAPYRAELLKLWSLHRIPTS